MVVRYWLVWLLRWEASGCRWWSSKQLGCEAGEGGDIGALDTVENQKEYLPQLGAALGPGSL